MSGLIFKKARTTKGASQSNVSVITSIPPIKVQKLAPTGPHWAPLGAGLGEVSDTAVNND
jgi:hypothetical protein